MSDVLRRLVESVDVAERRRMFNETDWNVHSEPVHRTIDRASVRLEAADDLMYDFVDRSPAWPDRAVSDRWLAPRLHHTLRLGRAEAADADLWAWLAIRYHDYVDWRWSGAKGVAENRFRGPVHKQALARLWWGAELFRNGPDYHPVEKAFVYQDFPNSYLHRPIARCRSLALGLVEIIDAPVAESPDPTAASAGFPTPRTADDINDLARVLNLSTAGSPPEVETGYRSDDHTGFGNWLMENPAVPHSWDRLPPGPPCVDTDTQSLEGGRLIADRAWSIAHATAERSGTRSARRRRSASV